MYLRSPCRRRPDDGPAADDRDDGPAADDRTTVPPLTTNVPPPTSPPTTIGLGAGAAADAGADRARRRSGARRPRPVVLRRRPGACDELWRDSEPNTPTRTSATRAPGASRRTRGSWCVDAFAGTSDDDDSEHRGARDVPATTVPPTTVRGTCRPACLPRPSNPPVSVTMRRSTPWPKRVSTATCRPVTTCSTAPRSGRRTGLRRHVRRPPGAGDVQLCRVVFAPEPRS